MHSTAERQIPNPIGPEVSGSEAFYRTALESLSEGVMILVLRADSEPTACAPSKGAEDEAKLFEFEMKRKDGRLHWIKVKATPYRNDGGEVVGRVVALRCIARQKNLGFENEFLQDEFRASFGNIIGQSPALQKVLAQIATVAPTEAHVLILGESGTGKELVARAAGKSF